MARDPYEILGVPKTATIDEIKAKYKELVKKYHPDKHKDNPLSDLAEEKFKEIQEAYETIIKGKTSSSYDYSSSYNSSSSYYNNNTYSNSSYESNSSYSNSYSSYSSYSNYSIYQEVRQLINSGKYIQAEAILDGNPSNDAEWYFLKAVILAFRGLYYNADTYILEALKKDPNNPEYNDFRDKLLKAAKSDPFAFDHTYSRSYRSREMADDMCCNCLSLLCCLQFCCGSS
ncbi:MAG: DnaJ domain-containing protein [Spirochaetes bacterium]|nr:DnaJ domain-containing protein [Spirochaetota bacterium]